MPFAKEPYRLEDRTALIVGPTNELTCQIAAKLSAVGAKVMLPSVQLPLSSELVAAIESADVLILQTVADANSAPSAADDWESIDRLHRLHVTLPTVLMAKAVPAMRRRHWGRVIFLAGGNDAGPAAIAVRSAQSALMQAEARRLAVDGITINLVLTRPCPLSAYEDLATSVAAAALYFAGNESSFVTGQTLRIGRDVDGKRQ
jgi:NAD(P)-dependent dehydrogenase (short-subunit alcohol dehydrogenase family)